MLEYDGEYYHELPPSIDGPVFGVLNLDASIPFRLTETELDKLHPDVRKPEHWTDVRVVSIIAKMEQVALQIGQCFSRSFGQNQSTPRNPVETGV